MPVGPNATPPPRQIGLRVDPKRARPVPFWRHGLRPPPLTSPRLLAFARFIRPLVRYESYACFSSSLLPTSTPKIALFSFAATIALLPVLVKVGVIMIHFLVVKLRLFLVQAPNLLRQLPDA